MNHLCVFVSLGFLRPQMLWFSILGWICFGKIGGEVGLHRYFCHRSFVTTPFRNYLLMFLSVFNCFGPPLSWVGVHRKHHGHSDQNQDPHGAQPYWRIWSTLWQPFHIEPYYVRDLLMSKSQRFVFRNYFKILFFAFGVTALISPWLPVYLISWPSVISFHSAGLVNTICHRWGYRNFATNDNSFNNTWVNLITLGSGLHNNHHAFPEQFCNKTKPHELDIPGWIIKTFFSKKKKLMTAIR